MEILEHNFLETLFNTIQPYDSIKKIAEPFAKATNKLSDLENQFNKLLAGRVAARRGIV